MTNAIAMLNAIAAAHCATCKVKGASACQSCEVAAAYGRLSRKRDAAALGEQIAAKTAERDAIESDFCSPCRALMCGSCGIGQDIDHLDSIIWTLTNRRDNLAAE